MVRLVTDSTTMPAPKQPKRVKPAAPDPEEEKSLLRPTTRILDFKSPEFDAYSALHCAEPILLDLTPGPTLDNIEKSRRLLPPSDPFHVNPAPRATKARPDAPEKKPKPPPPLRHIAEVRTDLCGGFFAFVAEMRGRCYHRLFF